MALGPVNPDDLRRIIEGGLSGRQRRKMIRGLRLSALPGVAQGERMLGGVGGFGAITDDIADSVAEARFPDMIANVNRETMRVTQSIVAEGIEKGLGADDIARQLEERFTSWASPAPGKQGRAEMIARTETAAAYNTATVQTYRRAGVEKVRVHDGDLDDACREAVASSPWSLDRAESNPTAHPNCTRGFSPIVEGV